MRLRAAALGAAALAAALATAATAAAPPRFDGRDLNGHRDQIQRAARAADVVFVGTVTRLGPAPAAWSDYGKATQQVTYRVAAFLKGRAARTIAVDHLVVYGSRNAARSRPGLALTRFAVGSTVIVMVTRTSSGFEDLDENYGTIPDSAANEAALKSLL